MRELQPDKRGPVLETSKGSVDSLPRLVIRVNVLMAEKWQRKGLLKPYPAAITERRGFQNHYSRAGYRQVAAGATFAPLLVRWFVYSGRGIWVRRTSLEPSRS